VNTNQEPKLYPIKSNLSTCKPIKEWTPISS